MRSALERISKQKIIVKEIELPTPFGFPIMVDRLSRDKLTSETLEERIKKMAVERK
jgi:ATP-dependent helicase Lhr and Lhr-like helicase